MAYFGADLQNANNILKTTEILAMWELINEPESHFINAKINNNNNNNKYTAQSSRSCGLAFCSSFMYA